MFRSICFVLATFFFVHNNVAQALSGHPYSSQSEIGHGPCKDTLRVLSYKREYDIGVILPSWPPVVDENYVAILEGTVQYDQQSGKHGPHITHEDLPFYHYSHDVNWNILPDETPDHRFENLSPYMIYEGQHGVRDTILRKTVHVEWESGLGSINLKNPCRNANNQGNSAGFFSEGHERGDIIWNWPGAGDWAHIEGHYVWDRGHPPAYTEIHPPRFVLFKRSLPHRLNIGGISKYCMRVDVFASGDGSALRNNRIGVKKFVRRVRMSSKDYEVNMTMILPRPSPTAQLKYVVRKRKGDSFAASEIISLNSDSGTTCLLVPWKKNNVSDMAVYARSIYFFWDEGSGTTTDYPIDEYQVQLRQLHFKKLSEVDGRAEIRMYANVGSDWIFLNDFHGKRGKILSRGMGKTRKKKWVLNNEFTVYVPRDKKFRVYTAGYETDGVDLLMGDLQDPSSPCDKKTKRIIKAKLFSIKNMLLMGCVDDEIGEAANLHHFATLSDKNYFVIQPTDGVNEDPCPFSKYPLAGRYSVSYEIERK